ncbi:hypothetical protein FJ959_09935 [Mesorhizobium sp. B2-2-4]|uniref:hypothetical protein n=1 Tax=unclassified Mesorhizobium TaxID=325217 RepID=UPI00112BEDF3|nr:MULTISPECIES: hypothetical protein [unclassified Mesorhizobium]TPM59178.1 hypothetical protein FJ959_09935 [Mesorhizobium sp. B2-2-4]TPM67663.1 hypothetical protein FJ965_11075 [Mesorhizobium sp. B2-2-1]TPN66944.1 hypothetical protein FJ984_15935 [Mesorhizobium sp. B1-1-3]
MKANSIALALSCGLLSACAASSAMRTSANTAIIQSSAAPVCGGIGAARVAEKQAAIETLKAGYDRYIIYDAAASNDVRVTQMPGSYQTMGSASVYGNTATFNANTQYIPGPTIVSGGHHQALGVKMFKDGEQGAAQAIPARDTLGPDWQKLLKEGTVHSCT